jgi:hypothetical protein
VASEWYIAVIHGSTVMLRHLNKNFPLLINVNGNCGCGSVANMAKKRERYCRKEHSTFMFYIVAYFFG